MRTYQSQTPVGLQDTLPGECKAKRILENKFRQIFALNGYQEIETPILEYYEGFDDPIYGYQPESLWKTFDQSGRILTVRPDSTIPTARIVGTSLKDAPLPLRLCYLQTNVKMESNSLSRLCEHFQAGIELLGTDSPAADAEVIALAIACLKAAGLSSFQIELGQAEFFYGIMQEAGLNQEQADEIRRLTEKKDGLGIQLYLDKLQVSPKMIDKLLLIPRLYGGTEVIEKALSITQSEHCKRALNNLSDVISKLHQYGCDDLTIDLGLVQEAGYYSGIIFQGFCSDVGQPILSGGRYNNLTNRFGRPLPSVGFAIMMKMIMIALEKQGMSFQAPMPDYAIAFDEDSFASAVDTAQRMRALGSTVILLYGTSKEELRQKLEQNCASRGMYFHHSSPEEV